MRLECLQWHKCMALGKERKWAEQTLRRNYFILFFWGGGGGVEVHVFGCCFILDSLKMNHDSKHQLDINIIPFTLSRMHTFHSVSDTCTCV